MDDMAGAGPPAHKILGAGRIKLRVAVASVITLGLGFWLKPPTVLTTLSAPQERAAPLLDEQVQLREAARPFRGVQEVMDRVRGFGVAIPHVQRARVPVLSDFSVPRHGWDEVSFGVVVSERHVLTHATALAGRESASVATAETTHEMRIAAYDPATGLALLESGSPLGAPAPIGAEPEAGMLVAAAAAWQGRDVAVPLFVTSVAPDRYTVTSTVPRTLQAMPLYTLEGELLAVLSGDGPEWQAFPAGPAVQNLLARAGKGERLASVGAAFQQLTPPLQQAFGEGGVLISDVVDGGPAGLAGVQAGDVLLRVGEVDVATVEAAVEAVNAIPVGVPTALEVRRTGRVREVEVIPAPAHQVSWLARRERPGAPALEARDALPAEVLDASGIPPDARVLAVNGRAVSSRAQVDRELRRAASPMRVLVRDGETQFFAAVEPRR
jgi:hypothetical protein